MYLSIKESSNAQNYLAQAHFGSKLVLQANLMQDDQSVTRKKNLILF
jgi:hypothetical protein